MLGWSKLKWIPKEKISIKGQIRKASYVLKQKRPCGFSQGLRGPDPDLLALLVIGTGSGLTVLF